LASPLIQLSPNFELASSVDELPNLHPTTAKIFSRKDELGKLVPIRLFYHQQRAIEIALRQENYVVSTRTGSGKSLSFFIPIVDWVLKNQPESRQVRAIIVYPLNALINSQFEALKEFLQNAPEAGICAERSTGQESNEEKSRIRENPPRFCLQIVSC
jgi:ATP-dependent helicase YprA (DUF1998 family)